MPPVHLVKRAAVLRRASSSVHKEGVFHFHNSLNVACTVYDYDNFLHDYMHACVCKQCVCVCMYVCVCVCVCVMTI